MVTYIAVGIMVLMAVMEVIFMNGIFICFSVTALVVALLSVFKVPYIFIALVAVCELVLTLVFLRPFIRNYMSNKINEVNKKYQEMNEANGSEDETKE